MKFDRRHFCSVMAIGSAGIVGRTVSAQTELQITGTIDSAVGADVEGVELFFQQVDTGSFWRYTVPASGDIDLTVSETGEFRVRLDNTSARNANVPLLYSFGRTTVESTGTNVKYTIPQSYDVKIQCLDEKDTPVERLPIGLGAGGYSHRPGLFTTSEQGYVKFIASNNTSSQPELQLAGPTSVEVQSTNTENQELGVIDVEGNAEYTFEITNTEKYKYNFKIIEPDPDAGFYLPYLLYIPDVDQSYERPLYVEPLNSLNTTDREKLDKQLINAHRDETFAGARRNGYPGIVAGLPRPPNDNQDLIQGLNLPSYGPEIVHESDTLADIATEAFSVESLTRVDQQLLAMIDDAKSRLESEPYPVAERIHMSGFSAAGLFCHRFAFLYPDRVRTLTTGGYNGLPLPKASHADLSLPYPLGTADYEELTGREFDKEAWADINRYIYVGQEDQGSRDYQHYSPGSARYPDRAETLFGINRVTERFPFIRSQYMEATNNAEFEIFDGIGHSIDNRMEDAIVDFHQENSPSSTEVEVRSVELSPQNVDGTTETHVLTFDVVDLSADGGKDNFTISLPDSINVEDATITKTSGLDPAPADPVAQNQITFTVNPESSIQNPINMTVELKLSPST